MLLAVASAISGRSGCTFQAGGRGTGGYGPPRRVLCSLRHAVTSYGPLTPLPYQGAALARGVELNIRNDDTARREGQGPGLAPVDRGRAPG